jgi:hypothetical protein
VRHLDCLLFNVFRLFESTCEGERSGQAPQDSCLQRAIALAKHIEGVGEQPGRRIARQPGSPARLFKAQGSGSQCLWGSERPGDVGGMLEGAEGVRHIARLPLPLTQGEQQLTALGFVHWLLALQGL